MEKPCTENKVSAVCYAMQHAAGHVLGRVCVSFSLTLSIFLPCVMMHGHSPEGWVYSHRECFDDDDEEFR